MAEERRYIWHCGNCRKDRHPTWNGRTEPSCIACGSTDMRPRDAERPEEDIAGCAACGEPLRPGEGPVCKACRAEGAEEVETVTLTDGAVIPRKAAELAAGWIWLDLKRIRDKDI